MMVSSAPELEDPTSIVRRRWSLLLLVGGGVVQLAVLWYQRRGVGFGAPYRIYDSKVLEYVGWFAVHGGGRPYEDIWTIKPPLTHEVAAVLALASGGDLMTYHYASVAATSVVALLVGVLVGAVVHRVTGDGVAALTAGATVYVGPVYLWRAGIGYKAKYFVLLAGLLGVLLALRDRPVAAGVAGAASAGFWQPGAAFAVVVAGIAADRRGRSGLARVVAGGTAATAVVLLPVVLWGAVEEMVAEVLLGPLLRAGGRTPAARFDRAVTFLGLRSPLVLLGAVGLATELRRRPRDRWWLGAIALWPVLMVLFVDMDGPADLFPPFAMAAVGVGLLVARMGPRFRRAVPALVAVGIVVPVVLAAGGATVTPVDDPRGTGPMNATGPLDATEKQHLFWTGQSASSCRIFMRYEQRKIVDAIGGQRNASTCGNLTLYRRALLQD